MFAEISELKFPRIKTDVITVYNGGSEVLPACRAAFITGCSGDGRAVPLFEVCGDHDPYHLWGVLSRDLAPGSAGTMQMNGLCRAFIQDGDTGDRVNADINSGIVTSPDGNARIIYPGNEIEPGLLMLGSNGGSTDSYNGSFKVTRGSTANTLHISEGYTDLTLSGSGRIEEQEITFLPGDEYVYFCAKRRESAVGYDIYITANEDEAAESIDILKRKLAYLRYDPQGNLTSIEQLWRGSDGIFFGGRYILA